MFCLIHVKVSSHWEENKNLSILEADMWLPPFLHVKDTPNKEGSMNSISLIHSENSVIGVVILCPSDLSFGYLVSLKSPQATQGPLHSSLMLMKSCQSSLLIIGSQEAYTAERNQAPGPNGFPIFLGYLKEDIINSVHYFHSNQAFAKKFTASFIALIPKKPGATDLKDFKPISLTQEGKVESQDNVQAGYPKAYGHVKLDLFIEYSQTNGVWEWWLKLIEYCIKTVKFSVMVNGEPMGVFHPKEAETRGIQISDRVGEEKEICSMLYADDTIIFSEPVAEHIKYIRVILVLFEAIVGLRVKWGRATYSQSRRSQDSRVGKTFWDAKENSYLQPILERLWVLNIRHWKSGMGSLRKRRGKLVKNLDRLRRKFLWQGNKEGMGTPQSLVAGLMWLGVKNERYFMRHVCQDSDELKQYGWTSHNGRDYGHQVLSEQTMTLTTSFLKSKDHGSGYGGDWAVRIGVQSDESVPDEEMLKTAHLFFYVADEGGKSLTLGSRVLDIHGDSILASGSRSDIGDWQLHLFSEDVSGVHYSGFKTPHIHNLSDLVQANLAVQARQFGHLQLSDSSDDSPNILVFQISARIPFKADIVFLSGTSTRDSRVEERASRLTASSAVPVHKPSTEGLRKSLVLSIIAHVGLTPF
ncbi:hypothetical protein MTR67_022511 [Solanum verrucosum]|uniref:Mannosyl-oligosaccharide glucosidase n=1 Tax=Solanum verrucosum TaxID=315347 RepID=A0AAF0QZ30_SOLVR|nr:hypothetical protein MTR67_022511 [Solanum verrucosum]